MLGKSLMCPLSQLHFLRTFPPIRLQGLSWFSSLPTKNRAPINKRHESCNQHINCCSTNMRTPDFVPTIQLPVLNCIRMKQTKAEGRGLGDVHNKEYIELYFIKNISFMRVLCRFSRLSSLMFLFATPASIVSTQFGVLAPSTSTNIILTFAAYAVIFTTQSYLFSSRVIGKIMMSSDEEVVKVSHLSLFGDRRDVFLRPSDFVPLRKEKGRGYLEQNLCQVQIRSYPKRLLYMPLQGHSDTDHERIDLLLSGKYSKSEEI